VQRHIGTVETITFQHPFNSKTADMKLFKKLSTPICTACTLFLYPVLSMAEEPADSSISRNIAETLMPLINLISGNQWVQGILVILITFIIASGLTWLLFKMISSITRRTSFVLDDQIATLLRPPLYYTLVVFGITAGLELMPLTENIRVMTQRIIQTINVLVWFMFLVRLSTILLNRVAGLSHKYTFIQHRTVTLFDNLAKIIVFGAGIYFIFVIWNIDMTAWLASAGIAGIAIGFAAKDTLSNLFSGVFIIADAPYKVGDYVVLDNIGRGKVTNIGLRSTRILTRDDIEVTVPNSIIGNSTIINQSGGPNEKMRVRLKIGVAYGSDVDKVSSLLKKVADEEPQVCKLPTPRVRFRLFGPSSLDFELLFWVNNPELRGRVLDALNTKVYKMLSIENIEIPYSKQDIYIKGLPEKIADLTTEKK
jgi:MscS family membrane protein